MVAYELLTGYLPFESDDLEALRLAVLQDEPEPIREMPDNVNVAFQKAMAKDAAERFESCTDFVRSLGGTKIPVASKPAPAPIPEKKPSAPAPAAPDMESLMKRGHLYLEDANWRQANDYFDRVLDIDPEYAPAYIGKLCVELEIRSKESLGDNENLISEYGNFQKAVRFAGDEYKHQIKEYDEKIRKRIKKKQYDGLVHAKNRASTENEFLTLARQLRDMNGYKDTNELALDCDSRYHSLKGRREEQERIQAKQERVERERREEQKRQDEERQRSEEYTRLEDEVKKASTEEDWKKLAEQYQALNGYKDTIELADQCENKCREEEVKTATKAHHRRKVAIACVLIVRLIVALFFIWTGVMLINSIFSEFKGLWDRMMHVGSICCIIGIVVIFRVSRCRDDAAVGGCAAFVIGVVAVLVLSFLVPPEIAAYSGSIVGFLIGGFLTCASWNIIQRWVEKLANDGEKL